MKYLHTLLEHVYLEDLHLYMYYASALERHNNYLNAFLSWQSRPFHYPKVQDLYVFLLRECCFHSGRSSGKYLAEIRCFRNSYILCDIAVFISIWTPYLMSVCFVHSYSDYFLLVHTRAFTAVHILNARIIIQLISFKIPRKTIAF